MPQAILIARYYALANQCQFVYVNSFDATGTTAGVYPGAILTNSSTLSIRTTGTFATLPGFPQGITVPTTVVYVSAT